MDLKKWFLPTTAPPFEKSALPFQNPRSSTADGVGLKFQRCPWQVFSPDGHLWYLQ